MTLMTSSEVIGGAAIVAISVFAMWILRDKNTRTDFNSLQGTLRLSFLPVSILVGLVCGLILIMNGIGRL
jgi:pilus assembly protein TadC